MQGFHKNKIIYEKDRMFLQDKEEDWFAICTKKVGIQKRPVDRKLFFLFNSYAMFWKDLEY